MLLVHFIRPSVTLLFKLLTTIGVAPLDKGLLCAKYLSYGDFQEEDLLEALGGGAFLGHWLERNKKNFEDMFSTTLDFF